MDYLKGRILQKVIQLVFGIMVIVKIHKVKGQYLKNIGNEVEVLTRDGRKMQGVLTAVSDDEFTIEVAKKVKEPGAKRPSIVMEPETLKIDNTKSVKYLINFK